MSLWSLKSQCCIKPRQNGAAKNPLIVCSCTRCSRLWYFSPPLFTSLWSQPCQSQNTRTWCVIHSIFFLCANIHCPFSFFFEIMWRGFCEHFAASLFPRFKYFIRIYVVVSLFYTRTLCLISIFDKYLLDEVTKRDIIMKRIKCLGNLSLLAMQASNTTITKKWWLFLSWGHNSKLLADNCSVLKCNGKHKLIQLLNCWLNTEDDVKIIF